MSPGVSVITPVHELLSGYNLFFFSVTGHTVGLFFHKFCINCVDLVGKHSKNLIQLSKSSSFKAYENIGLKVQYGFMHRLPARPFAISQTLGPGHKPFGMLRSVDR